MAATTDNVVWASEYDRHVAAEEPDAATYRLAFAVARTDALDCPLTTTVSHEPDTATTLAFDAPDATQDNEQLDVSTQLDSPVPLT